MNFVKLLTDYKNFVELLTDYKNFVKLLTDYKNFVKLFAVLRILEKFGFVQGTFYVRFDRLTFLKNLYITTTLLSGRYLQCFCIVTTCL